MVEKGGGGKGKVKDKDKHKNNSLIPPFQKAYKGTGTGGPAICPTNILCKASLLNKLFHPTTLNFPLFNPTILIEYNPFPSTLLTKAGTPGACR